MTVSRLREIPGIGVDRVGDAADARSDPELLRLENLDTDLRPPQIALDLTRAAVDDDAANSWLPFQGRRSLREAAARHGDAHWDALARALERHPAWLLWDAAMERLRFDGSPPRHPARHPGLRDRTVTVGSASKELRMIGWRTGWGVGAAPLIADVHLVGLSNVCCQVGLGQEAVAAALTASDAEADVAHATEIWAT